jgi:arginyl-tRNA synthetase
VTANEQDQYFKVNLKVQSLVLPELVGKNMHVSHGMMTLPTGKMSSRTGDVISAEELLELAREYVLEVMKDREMEESMKQRIVLQIAVAGIKYIILRQSSSKDVVFDMKKALSFEGDSGPYVQYATVRARSVIARARAEGIVPVDFDVDAFDASQSDIAHVVRKIYVFPEIIERAYTENSSHIVTTYITELSSMFNVLYAHNKIIDTSSESAKNMSGMLVSLIQSIDTVLTNGLYVLGIEVPEKM